VIDAAPGHVWAAVADAGAVHRRLLPGRVTDARLEGDVRILTMPGGAEIRELIVAVDHEARRMAYSVQGGQRMALAHHHASFQVFDAGGGRSRLVWVTDILPHDRAPAVLARCEVAIAEMKDVLEAAQPARTASTSEPSGRSA
jgi:carbon monoxide dehydrogenase subunit G